MIGIKYSHANLWTEIQKYSAWSSLITIRNGMSLQLLEIKWAVLCQNGQLLMETPVSEIWSLPSSLVEEKSQLSTMIITAHFGSDTPTF